MTPLDAITAHLASTYGEGFPGRIWVGGHADGFGGRTFTTTAEAAVYAEKLDAAGRQGVYHRGTTMQPVDEGRGKDEDSIAVYEFRLDLDLNDGTDAHKKDTLPSTDEELSKLLEEAGFHKPTRWIDSGHGRYAAWQLDEPADLTDPAVFERVTKLWADLSAHVIEVGKRHGWKLDNCRDLARIWRVPGTTNRKVAGDERVAAVMWDTGRCYTLDQLADILPAPLPPSGKAQNGHHGRHDGIWTREQAGAEVRTWLDKVASKRQGDGFNDMLNHAAMRLGRFIPALHTRAAAESLLEDAVRRVFTAPDSADLNTIRYGLDAGEKQPFMIVHVAGVGNVDDHGPDDWEDTEPPGQEDTPSSFDADVLRDLHKRRVRAEGERRFSAERAAEQAAANKLRIVEGFDFLYGDIEDETPIWGNADVSGWAEGESLMIYGPPNVGKSTLAHQLVLGRLGLVSEVLGMPVRDDGGKVLYLAADRPKQIRRAFRRLARPEWKDVVTARLVLHAGPLPVDVTVDKDWLADLAQQHQATTVVVDSLKDLCTDPRDGRCANGYNLARQECIARGIEWMELHHNRKANGENKKPTKLDDVYGDRFLTGGAGSVVCLWGEAGDRVVELSQVKTPSGLLYPTKVEINFSTGGMSVHTDGRPRSALEAVQRGPIDGLTAGQVCKVLGKPTTGRPVENVRTQLDRHAARGEIIKQKHPVDGLTYYAPPVDAEPEPTASHEQGTLDRDAPWVDLNPYTNT